MTWTLIYLLAGHLQIVPDLPTYTACVAEYQRNWNPSAHSPHCVQVADERAKELI